MSDKTMLIVSDTGPLITFLKINKLELLDEMYGEIRIPPAVYDELTRDKRFPFEKKQIDDSSFIVVDGSFDKAEADRLLEYIHQGESEAIALVQHIEKKEERPASLLVDDHDAREIAAQEGIDTIGAIGVLCEAAREELLTLDEAEEAIQVMKATHRYYTESEYQSLREAASDVDRSEGQESPEAVVKDGIKQYTARNGKSVVKKK